MKEYWIIDLQKDVLVIHSVDSEAPLQIQPLSGKHPVYVSGEVFLSLSEYDKIVLKTGLMPLLSAVD